MDETQQAIARIKRGDWSRLEGLVCKYQAKTVYTAYLEVQDRQAAGDVVQNAFCGWSNGSGSTMKAALLNPGSCGA